MSLVLTVSDIMEVNGKDGYMDFKLDEVGYQIGYSCLTPEADVTHIKQYIIFLGDDYYMTCVSYFSNDMYVVDYPFGSMDRLPHIGESYTIKESQIQSASKSDRLVRIVPRDICCIYDTSATDKYLLCYCYRESKEDCRSPGFYRWDN